MIARQPYQGSSNRGGGFRLIAATLLALVLAGCASRPVNKPIDERHTFFSPLRHTETKYDPTFALVLAFSGGGTRAAALSYGVLEELRRTVIPGPPARRLLDEIDAITGVSGGSFTALAYALYGESLFQDYETRFLKRNVQGHLIESVFNPVNWPALWSVGYGRSELAADYYDEILFEGATFKDIFRKPGTPAVLVAATDIATGSRFAFIPDDFELICSDLMAFPLSRAAAASSAVPVVLSAVTLNNYAGRCGPALSHKLYTLTGADATKLPGRARLRYKEGVEREDSVNRPYLHLVDGGVSDNLGLRPLVEAIGILEQSPVLRQITGFDKLQRLAVIVVNAHSDPPTDWSRNESPPGPVGQLLKTSTVPIDRYSYDQIELLKDMVERWSLLRDCSRLAILENRHSPAGAHHLTALDFYPIDISFDDIADPEERRYFLNLPTTFVLQPEAIDRIRTMASTLMRTNPTYQTLLRELGAN